MPMPHLATKTKLKTIKKNVDGEWSHKKVVQKEL